MADGQRIAELRTARNLTIAGLARAADIARPTIYAAEAGAPVNLDTLVKIARALGVPLSAISADAARLVEGVA